MGSLIERFMKINEITKGNCVDLMKKIKAKSVNLVLTDPPYNISGKSKLDLAKNTTGGPWYKMDENWDVFKDFREYQGFSKEWISEADRVLVDSGAMMICCSYHGLGEILISLKELEYKILNIIIWRKGNHVVVMENGNLISAFRYITIKTTIC